ncbi:hypothetical protein TNIN_4841 [Trichonephila inaurata madagascariensis]|uniref:Uncharacterized protein n=1 Tax=Trichonephila inaurata madagascariensis TaxID=2747483 RepID=A0A8X7BYN4_9ARAC|nr:hypothetical protein TNIN_4841 [Trichonephila inaurata madagascariensis]
MADVTVCQMLHSNDYAQEGNGWGSIMLGLQEGSTAVECLEVQIGYGRKFDSVDVSGCKASKRLDQLLVPYSRSTSDLYSLLSCIFSFILQIEISSELDFLACNPSGG